MSVEEVKKPRTVQDIQAEYQQGCMKAGHMQYQIRCIEKDLNLLNEQLQTLNLEAAQVAAAAKSEEANKEAS